MGTSRISIPKVQFRARCLRSSWAVSRDFNSKGPIQRYEATGYKVSFEPFQFQRSNSERRLAHLQPWTGRISIPKVQFREEPRLLQGLIRDISIPKVQFRGAIRSGTTPCSRISIPKVQFRALGAVRTNWREVNFNSKGPIQSCSGVALHIATRQFQFQRSNSE